MRKIAGRGDARMCGCADDGERAGKMAEKRRLM